jgi:hypothetical protein
MSHISKRLESKINSDELHQMVDYFLEDMETDREAGMLESVETFGDEGEVKRRFGKGSFGAHEAADRASILMENVESYLLTHPTVELNERAFKLAYLANQFLFEVYQVLACSECEE